MSEKSVLGHYLLQNQYVALHYKISDMAQFITINKHTHLVICWHDMNICTEIVNY